MHSMKIQLEIRYFSSSCTSPSEPDFFYPCFPVTQPSSNSERRQCVPFVRSFAACPQDPATSQQRQQVGNITHYVDGSNIYGSVDFLAEQLRNVTCK